MKDENINLLVIEGTTRPGRRSIHAANFIVEIGSKVEGLNVRLADPAELTLPGDGNDPENVDPKFTEMAAWADAFIVVTPEYNHSFPGSLKRLLDSEYDNYVHKPVSIAGVSSGMLGGARAVESLVPVLRTLGLTVSKGDVFFMHAGDLFDEQGSIDEEQRARYEKAVNGSISELLWLAKSLKYGRENL